MQETPFDSGRETLVFVYGTLMRGQRNHSLLFGSRYVGEGMTLAEFELVDLGDFPALIPAVEGGDSFAVAGEVYAVDHSILEILDEIEDHPRFYRRTPIELADGSLVDVYLLTVHQAAFYPRIETGDWRTKAQAG
ncbi:MAG: gamma-glutamylcyclotransferase [Planctomycetota bacterium]|nr:gamma-glutamylcyclotransferase [Planctomycetota bacterium]